MHHDYYSSHVDVTLDKLFNTIFKPLQAAWPLSQAKNYRSQASLSWSHDCYSQWRIRVQCSPVTCLSGVRRKERDGPGRVSPVLFFFSLRLHRDMGCHTVRVRSTTFLTFRIRFSLVLVLYFCGGKKAMTLYNASCINKRRPRQNHEKKPVYLLSGIKEASSFISSPGRSEIRSTWVSFLVLTVLKLIVSCFVTQLRFFTPQFMSSRPSFRVTLPASEATEASEEDLSGIVYLLTSLDVLVGSEAQDVYGEICFISNNQCSLFFFL